jgi:hypothetical protein
MPESWRLGGRFAASTLYHKRFQPRVVTIAISTAISRDRRNAVARVVDRPSDNSAVVSGKGKSQGAAFGPSSQISQHTFVGLGLDCDTVLR